MTDPRDRALELLADRAVFGLSPAEQGELDALLAVFSAEDADALDRIAADLARGGLPADPAPIPSTLAARIAVDAAPHLHRPGPARRGNPRTLAALAALAAALLIVGTWWAARPGRPVGPPSPAERRAELLARAGQPGAEVVRVEWTATADPAARGASGDVVWSGTAQEGYMLFRGLAPNAPAREQYQLWVFDEARDERYPVDGGVFDVPPGGGDVVVPIRVKLGVTRAVVFAVTVEPPGGVVVSTRERVPLLAKVPPGAG
jgi:hypothetical protein